jgi:hypothetical protein
MHNIRTLSTWGSILQKNKSQVRPDRGKFRTIDQSWLRSRLQIKQMCSASAANTNCNTEKRRLRITSEADITRISISITNLIHYRSQVWHVPSESGQLMSSLYGPNAVRAQCRNSKRQITSPTVPKNHFTDVSNGVDDVPLHSPQELVKKWKFSFPAFSSCNKLKYTHAPFHITGTTHRSARLSTPIHYCSIDFNTFYAAGCRNQIFHGSKGTRFLLIIMLCNKQALELWLVLTCKTKHVEASGPDPASLVWVPCCMTSGNDAGTNWRSFIKPTEFVSKLCASFPYVLQHNVPLGTHPSRV